MVVYILILKKTTMQPKHSVCPNSWGGMCKDWSLNKDFLKGHKN